MIFGFSKWCTEKWISNKDSKHISEHKTCISFFSLYPLRLFTDSPLFGSLFRNPVLTLVMYAGCPSLCQNNEPSSWMKGTKTLGAKYGSGRAGERWRWSQSFSKPAVFSIKCICYSFGKVPATLFPLWGPRMLQYNSNLTVLASRLSWIHSAHPIECLKKWWGFPWSHSLP